MDASEPLPPSTVRFIELALASGKQVGAELLSRYASQTGRVVPAVATAPAKARKKASPDRASPAEKTAAGNNRSFVAAHRDALAMIIEKVEGTDAAFCLATYLALRWLAFEAYRPDGPFPTTVALIAHRAGLGYNTAAKAAKVLEMVGVIEVQGQRIAGTKARAPSLYTFPVLRGTFPTEAPPRRAERYEEAEERKESLSGACWPEELPLQQAKALADAFAQPVERIHAWYATWVAKKIEFNDPKPSSPAQAFARFKAAVHSDRNRPLPKGTHESAFSDSVRPLPQWALDADQLKRQQSLQETAQRLKTLW